MLKKIKKFFNKIKKSLKRPIVSVVSINGQVASSGYGKSSVSFAGVNPKLEAAFKISNVKAVIISINSPGGSPVQSELIYSRIRMLSEQYKVPVITCAEDVAASGGYYIMLAGDELYAASNSIIGSIGVVTHGFGFDKLIKEHKIERRVVSQGANKSILDPFQPVKDSDIEILKSVQKDVYDNFSSLVKERRAGKLQEGKEVCDGSFWSSKASVELGLIDGIATIHQLVKEKFGEDAEIKYFAEKKSTIAKLLGSSIANEVENLCFTIINHIETRLFGKVKIDY